MSFVKKWVATNNPKHLERSNPVSAWIDEGKRGGDFNSKFTAALDPGELLGNNRTHTAAESADYIAGAKAKAEKRRAKNMAKGGKTVCRGMGKATRGGGYR